MGYELENQRVCGSCVGEPFMRADIIASGIVRKCDYCGSTGKTISLGELVDRVDLAFKQHFRQTSTEPDHFSDYC